MQEPTASMGTSWLDSILLSPGPSDFSLPATFLEQSEPEYSFGQYDSSLSQAQSDIPNLFLAEHTLRNDFRSQEDPPSPTTLQQIPEFQTQTLSNIQSARPISTAQRPIAPSLPRLSSESSGSHESLSASPVVAAERYPVSQPASLPGQALPQHAKAKAAGRRAKRQRPPAVNKLRNADEQIADLTKQLKAVELQKESLQLRNRLLEKDLQTTSTFVPWSDIVSQIVDDNTRQQVISMTHQEFVNLERRFADAFAEVLLECSPEETSSPAAKRLEALVASEFRVYCWFALSRSTLEEFQFLTSNPAINAAELLKSIGLSHRQSAALRMLRRVYARNLGPLLAERKRVYTFLQALGAPVRCGAYPPEAVALVERTQQLVKEEHSLLVALNLGLWRKVITPFQHASLQLQVSPAIHCDSFEMVDRLAKDAGEPDFAVLLHEAASLPAVVEVPMDSAIMAIPTFLAGNDPSCSGDMSDMLRNVWLLLGFQPR